MGPQLYFIFKCSMMENLPLLLLIILTLKPCVFYVFEFIWLQFPALGLCYLFSVSVIKALVLSTHESSYAQRETVFLSHKSFCHFEKFRRII